jgi:hypothetical protein
LLTLTVSTAFHTGASGTAPAASGTAFCNVSGALTTRATVGADSSITLDGVLSCQPARTSGGISSGRITGTASVGQGVCDPIASSAMDVHIAWTAQSQVLAPTDATLAVRSRPSSNHVVLGSVRVAGSYANSTATLTLATAAVGGVEPCTVVSKTSSLLPDESTLAIAKPRSSRSRRFLWKDDMESGNTSMWSADGGGGLYNSGEYSVEPSHDVSHSGSWSLKASIDTRAGTSGVRAFRWDEPRQNRTARYSVWVYIPQKYTLNGSQEWWNLFQFKSRTNDDSRVDPVWGFYAQEDAQGLYLQAGWGWGGTNVAGPRPGDDVSGKWYPPAHKVYLPVGRWVHLEAYLRQSRDFTGTLKFWQDGVLLYDISGIRTSYNNCNFNSWCADDEWSINLYSDGMTPNPASIYVDDVGITR